MLIPSHPQIDVIYLNDNLDWVIKENVTQLSEYNYITFDVEYDGSTANSVMFAILQDSSEAFSLWKYCFDTDYSLTYVVDCHAPLNFIPTSVEIVNYFSATDRKAILVGGLIEDSYYSQLFEYDFNLEIKNVIEDSVLGKILVIEYDEINGVDSIILGIERLAIGKMDAVVVLRRKSGTEEWTDFEITGFDDTKFKIIDLLAIADNNLRKLAIASETGVFQTSITYEVDTSSIVSPTCFVSEVFGIEDLSPLYYPVITPKETPIYMVNKITYKLNGDNNWYDLDIDKYRVSRTEIRLDLNSIWSNLAFVKVAYSFESFASEEKTSIDPSFKKQSGTSNIQTISASGLFYSDISLPLLWLNPATSYTSPLANWNWLPNSLTYQYTPVISGLGSTAIYPEVNSEWSSEYMMPELENSLIYYGDSYDSGILAQNLNAKDDYLGETMFDGSFEGNYIDGAWISNPYISENFNFSQMYYSEIHDAGSSGLYKTIDGEQRILVENSLVNIEPDNSQIALIYDSGTLPSSLSAEDLTDIDYPDPNSGWDDGNFLNTHTDDSNYIRLSTDWTGYGYTYFGYFEMDLPYNGDDFYFSFHATSSYKPCELKINGQRLYYDTEIDFDRELITDVNSITFDFGDQFTGFSADVFYFKLERVSSNNPAVQGASLAEMKSVFSNWSQYMTTEKDENGIFGFEFTYKLPVISKDSLEEIQVSFDASIYSLSFAQEYPLSLQLWNFEYNRWESLPVAPLDGNDYYYTDGLDLDFWGWHPTSSYTDDDMFRPKWGTTSLNDINTIGYGKCFPSTMDDNGNIVFDDSVLAGGSFLNNGDTSRQINTLFLDQTELATDQDYKVLFYDTDYNTNKFQLGNIIIDPNTPYTKEYNPFPAYQNGFSFDTNSEFYGNFINDLHEFKIRLITNRESGQVDDAYLCVGDFKTYTLTDTNYLNYDEFESNAIGTHHVSENIDFTSDGIELYGYSGFNLKEPERAEKFRDNFRTSIWDLSGASQDTIIFEKDIIDAAIARSLHPTTNYNIDNLSTYRQTYVGDHQSWAASIIEGTLVAGTDVYDTHEDDSNSMGITSEYFPIFNQRTKTRYSDLVAAKTFDLYYDIASSFLTQIYIYLGDIDSPVHLIASTEGVQTSLSGWTRVENDDANLDYIWIMSDSIFPHQIDVDWLTSYDVIEEIEAFIITPDLLDYLVLGSNDIWELEATIMDGGTNLLLYSVEEFNANTITWENRPYTHALLSLSPAYGQTFTLDLGAVKSIESYFKIDTETSHYGVDYWNPKVKYQLAKKHQEPGLLYMQSDESESLSLKSQAYTKNVSVTPNDQIVIEFKPKTSNEINFTLYCDGEVVQIFTIVPQGNNDFSSQFIILETNETIQFDQLMFSGALNDTDYLSVSSISVLEGASIIDTQLSPYDYIEESHKPYIETGTALTSSWFGHFEDDQYYNISSNLKSTIQELSIEFEFSIPKSETIDMNKMGIKLKGFATSASLEGATFKIKNLNSSLYENIDCILTDVDTFSFSILEDQFYKLEDGNFYTIFFKIVLTTSSEFVVHIDSLSVFTYKPWSVEHDLYRASFVIEPVGTGQTTTDYVSVSVNDDINITIYDSLLDYGDNVISFYYSPNEQKWHGYFYNNTYNDFTDLLDIVDSEFTAPKLRIESHYGDTNKGIIVKSIESQYYTQIQNEQDFTKYKSLIASYKAVNGHADVLELDADDNLITAENTFAQVSADVDIIYSFHDEMEHENIFEYELLPTFAVNSYDNLESYIYDETGFILNSASDLSDSYVTDFYGDATITGGSLTDLEEEDDTCDFRAAWSQQSYSSSSYIVEAEVNNPPYTSGPQDVTGWNIREDDGKERVYWAEVVATNEDWVRYSDFYHFDLANYYPPSSPADVDVEVKIHWGFRPDRGTDYIVWQNTFCKIYAKRWSSGVYEEIAEIPYEELTELTLDLDSAYYTETWGFPPSFDHHIDLKIVTQVWCYNLGNPTLQVTLDYLYVDEKGYQKDPNNAKVGFDFDNLLNGQNDFIIHFNGFTGVVSPTTTQFTSFLYVDDNVEHTFSNTDSYFDGYFADIDSIEAFIVSDIEGLDGQTYDRRLLIDYLYLEWLNQPVNITLKNGKKINITSSLSHKQQNPTAVDSGLYDDPYFGKNSIHFTLKNSIQTPIFGRENDTIWADLELSDLDLDFKVYPDTNKPLENNNIEGNDENKYVPAILGDYSEYSTSRFRHSAADDIQIPLLTPIQLDFGQIDLAMYERGILELALDLDIDLENRASDSTWSLRSRLLYYNYTSGYWEDFKGMIRIESQGYNRAVWDPVTFSDNFIDYLQDFNASNNVIPILNDNDINVKNPFTINNLNNNTIKDGVMKLAFISYIIPSNISIDPVSNNFVYERMNPEIPIEVSQTVDVIDCVFIGESRQIMYPEASLTANLELDENFGANLSLIDNLGEILAVKGVLSEDSVVYEYPIYYYWTTQDNELAFNSPMKYQFTNVSIEYIPQLLLTYNSSDGYWYLPGSFVSGDINYTKPFFVSDLWVNNTYYGTYIHPDVNVWYTIGSNDYGMFVDFTNTTHLDSVVKGTIHFGKVDDTSLYRFSLEDETLLRNNILTNSSDFAGGTLHLEFNTGFNDVIYSKLSQVLCKDYAFKISLYELDISSNELSPIGTLEKVLDSNYLGFHYYELDLSFDEFDYVNGGEAVLAETFTREASFDLYITLEVMISECSVDGDLFKGMFAYELLCANIEMESKNSVYLYNEESIEDPYFTISQNGIILTQVDTSSYTFETSDLEYN